MVKIRGKMRETVVQLGSGLTLKAGEIVRLENASNIPNGSTQWFASKLDGSWGENSILISMREVTQRGTIPGRGSIKK